ncbi:hypothetical protein FRC05_002366 [Tulasnella sp. 425]|nr:hypothetical protein FRC05_002366 [Tulasnella sp. 425]
MSNTLTESTALSPRPEQYHQSTSIRRRGIGASPQLPHSTDYGGKLYSEVSTPRLEEGWVGPHKNDDFLSPDLRVSGEGRTTDIVQTQRAPERGDPNVSIRLSHLGFPPPRLPEHQLGSGPPTPTPNISLSGIPASSPSALSSTRPSSTVFSSVTPIPPSRSHSGGTSRPTSIARTPSKRIPRLPTPDFSKRKSTGPYKQALAAPLNFFRGSRSSQGTFSEGGEERPRSGTDGQIPVGGGYLESFHMPSLPWNWSWMWGPSSGRTSATLVARTDSGGSTGSSSTDFSSSPAPPSLERRSSGLIATEKELGHDYNRQHSLPDAHYLRRSFSTLQVPSERPLSSIFEDDSSDEELIRKTERKRKHWRESTLSRLFPKPPPHRYPTLKSPNPNDHHDNSSFAPSPSRSTDAGPYTLSDILPSLQETSARFTQKFPWAARGAGPNGVQFVRLSGGDQGGEKSAVDAIGVSLSGEGEFGVEGVRRWNGFKWILMLSVTSVFLMGLSTLLVSIYTWFGAWSHAQAVITVEYNILIFATLAASTLILASLLGISGTLLNSRPILAFYSLLLWPSLVSVLIVGYTAYKRRTFNLSGKLSQSWNQLMDDNDRAIVQNTFQSPLRGCLEVLAPWEAMFLENVYSAVFASVPLHLANIVISMLCSNHVNRTFGKGLTPKAYRLSLADVQANAEKVMMGLSSTRMPHEPERLLSKRVRSVDEGGVAVRGRE